MNSSGHTKIARRTAAAAHAKPIEGLEERRMFTTFRGANVGNIVASDGTKENANNVTLVFDNTIKSVDASKIRFYSYATNTLLGGQVKVTIPIVSATISADKKSVNLVTGVQVRKGAYLTLNAGSIVDTGNAQVTTTPQRLKKGLNRDRFTLALRAFTPSDKSYFSSSVISGGATATTASTAESESAVLAQLTDFLARRVKEGTITSAKRDSALALFNSAASKATIAAPNLRAAVVALTGTIAEPAINVWLGTANTTGKTPIFVGFDSDGISSGAKDAELTYNSKGRLKLTFASDYAGESFAVLSARIAHETLHEGGSGNNVDSQDEEVVANFVESAVWAQQIVTDYRYSQKGTLYTTYANYHLYTLLNSGDRQFPRVGLLQAPLKNGSTNATPGFLQSTANFDALIRRDVQGRISDKPATAITAITAQILNNATGRSYTAANTTFHDELISDIDVSQGVLGDNFALRAARVLQVKVF